MASPKAPIGTRDILPPESSRWEALIATFAQLMGGAGYGLVQSPAFEDLSVFQRIGEGTDLVRKEMYEFEDKSGRHLALRPEGTASIARAFIQHRPTTPWKVWYAAPSFRYERPQAGRYRQHHQLGAEAVGSLDPDLDVEVIALAWDLFASLGLRRVVLLVNTMGDPGDREPYMERLSAYLEKHRGDLADEDRKKAAEHPLRVLDSNRAATRDVVRDAPRLPDHVSGDAVAHFERVQAGLGALEIPFVIEPLLVRGLDYYTRTTFELQASALDTAQDAIGGGGRYDGLVEALGGPPTPGIGFALGIERILLACNAEDTFGVSDTSVEVFVVDVAGGESARDLVAELRRGGIAADRAFDQRSMKAQMKSADRAGARLALIVGPDELSSGTVTVRDLEGGDQEVVARADALDRVRKTLS